MVAVAVEVAEEKRRSRGYGLEVGKVACEKDLHVLVTCVGTRRRQLLAALLAACVGTTVCDKVGTYITYGTVPTVQCLQYVQQVCEKDEMG